MYTGPNIVKDNTLLYFDTGSIKSYKGEPTTNFSLYSDILKSVTNGNQYNGQFYYNLATVYKTNNISPIRTSNAYLINMSGSSYDLYSAYTGLTVGSTYTFSIYVKLGSATNFTIVPNNTAGWNTVTGGTVFTGLSKDKYIRVSITFIAPSGGSVNIHLGGHSESITQQSAGSLYLWGHQFELNSHPTNYLSTSSSTSLRTSTQGLVPLLSQKKTSLDLTNMSHDTNSNLTFNGTTNNIKISDSVYNRTTGNELTICTVIKPGRNAGQYQDIVVNRSDSLYNWMLFQHTTDGSIQLHGSAQNKSTYIPTIGKYIHVTATVTSTGVYTLYINGVVKQTVTGYTYANMSPSLLCIGCFGSGQEPYLGKIDVVKIHTRALTQAEVVKDYNAIKSRFNI